MGCSTTRYVPVKEVEKEVTNHKDSIRIRDSIVVIPVERIIDIVPAYDTLKLETTQARAKAYVVILQNKMIILLILKVLKIRIRPKLRYEKS